MLVPGTFPKIFTEITVTNVSFATPFSTRRINKRSCNNRNSNSLIFWNLVFDILIFYVFSFRKPLLLNFCTGNITDQLGVPSRNIEKLITRNNVRLYLWLLWNNRYKHYSLIFWLFFSYFCHKSCKWCMYRFLPT